MTETYAQAISRKRREFREIITRDQLSVMPGGFTPIYAHVAQAAGFECFFVAGSQMSAYLLGVPDVGIIGLRDVMDHARHIAAKTDIPLLLDIDTGFGNVINLDFTIREAIQSGVAAVQVEDSEMPKKSGPQGGARCVPIAEIVGKYRAAVAARDEADPDFVICARCNALGAGENFDSVLTRAVAYADDGGVDLVWINAIKSLDQIATAVEKVSAPIMFAWGGGSPSPTLEAFEALGPKIVLYPTQFAHAALQTVWNDLHDLKARGPEAIADMTKRAKDSPWGSPNLRQLVNEARTRDIEEKFGPTEG